MLRLAIAPRGRRALPHAAKGHLKTREVQRPHSRRSNPLGNARRRSAPIVAQAEPQRAPADSGLSASGDLTGQMPSVAHAVAAGPSAAAMVVHSLMAKTFDFKRPHVAVGNSG